VRLNERAFPAIRTANISSHVTTPVARFQATACISNSFFCTYNRPTMYYIECMAKTQKQLFQSILAALADKKATEFTYQWEWLYDLPGHSISINDEVIQGNYALPTEYSADDLKALAELGYLEKLTETKGNKPFYEVTVIYRLKEYGD
jgi:hypothetical protein